MQARRAAAEAVAVARRRRASAQRQRQRRECARHCRGVGLGASCESVCAALDKIVMGWSVVCVRDTDN